MTHLLAAAREHRLHLVLAGLLDAQDGPLWRSLRDEYREAAAVDAARTAALQRLLALAARERAKPLVFKGAALAHTIYERSWERPHADADLFVADEDVPGMCRALDAAGYERATAVDGPLVTGQFQYARTIASGLDHHVDVHTRVFNPAAFAGALEWSEADRHAVPILALGPAARTLSDADALFVACVHRVAHHHAVPDLMWLCDFDRLARKLTAGDWDLFRTRVERARMRAVCRSSLGAAGSVFETPVPANVAAVLAAAGDEPSAAFLERGGGELDVQLLNLQHLPGWRARSRLVLQHLFPSRAYMRTRYGVASDWVLPFCYAHRVCVGVPRWLRAQRS